MPGGGGGGHHIWLETFFFPATSATAAMHLALLAAILGSTYRRERRHNREAALARPWRGMGHWCRSGACGFLAPKSRLMSCWLLRPCGNLSVRAAVGLRCADFRREGLARQCKVACGLARRRACEREAKREGERRAEELHVGGGGRLWW